MPQPTVTVRAFLSDTWDLVNPSSPTTPLQGDTQTKGLRIMNRLLSSFSANSLYLTIAKEIHYPVTAGQGLITLGPPDFVPTPDIIDENRLSNLESAYITLQGESYPLIIQDRHTFMASYKYAPLQGLPRFIILYPQTNITTIQLYPAPSQEYGLTIYGKFQLSSLGINDTMDLLPTYFQRWLQFAVAKDLAMYLGRAQAWTEVLEGMLVKAEMDMKAASSINIEILTATESMLNGNWRVMAGV